MRHAFDHVQRTKVLPRIALVNIGVGIEREVRVSLPSGTLWLSLEEAEHIAGRLQAAVAESRITSSREQTGR